MELRAILLACLISCAAAVTETDDLVAAEGHNLHSYASAPAPRYGGGGATATSYNRRGSYAQAGDLHKPTIYGSSYDAPRSVGHAPYPAPAYGHAPAPVASYGHAPAPVSSYGHAPAPVASYNHAPSRGHAPVSYAPSHQRYAPAPRSYGPPRNAFSEHSERASHDAHYDPSRDPVSQYAQYIPVFEYAPKSASPGNELSIYGYRK